MPKPYNEKTKDEEIKEISKKKKRREKLTRN